MSKVIRDTEKVNQRLIEALNRRHKREVARMDEGHEMNVSQLKKDQGLDLVNIQENHDRQVSSEQDRKERLLTQMKDHLAEQKRLTDKELKELKEHAHKETTDLATKNSTDRARLSGEHTESIELLNDKYNQGVRRINLEGQDRVDQMNQQQQALYADRAAYHQKRLDAEHTESSARFKLTTENNIRVKNEQEKTFEKERMATHQKHEGDINKMVKQHEDLYKKRDTLQREDLKGQDLFFEKRYAETYKRHNEQLKTLDDLSAKVIMQKQQELSKQVDFKETRAQDPFFQFVELNPTLEHTEQGIRIRVKVPEHSKQDLALNLNGKEAVINFNRRYIDTQKDEQGNSSRISKIETLSTRLQTGVHLDPKSVKSSYQDGTMTYEIKKA